MAILGKFGPIHCILCIDYCYRYAKFYISDLLSLSKCRLRGDIIEVLKVFCGLGNININDYVLTTVLTWTIRNNGFKIKYLLW